MTFDEWRDFYNVPTTVHTDGSATVCGQWLKRSSRRSMFRLSDMKISGHPAGIAYHLVPLEPGESHAL